MAEKVVPMIHVPDVRATVDWYESIGFTVLATYGDEGEGFAMLSFRKWRSHVQLGRAAKHSATVAKSICTSIRTMLTSFTIVLRIEWRSWRAFMTPFTECESSSSATSTGFG